jgi:hypothetical protein
MEALRANYMVMLRGTTFGVPVANTTPGNLVVFGAASRYQAVLPSRIGVRESRVR